MAVEDHKQKSPRSIACMVITVSDTRTEETDKSGNTIRQLLIEAGHTVPVYRIIKDEWEQIVQAVQEGAADDRVQAILLNGGTGIAKRDVTVEAVTSILDKELPGFGELFRYLSYTEDIGSAAIASRAAAGVYQNRIVFSMPGSTGAVLLAMKRLILPELCHLIYEATKHYDSAR